MPSVSKTSLALPARAVFKTSGTVFLIRTSQPVNNIYIFSYSYWFKRVVYLTVNCWTVVLYFYSYCNSITKKNISSQNFFDFESMVPERKIFFPPLDGWMVGWLRSCHQGCQNHFTCRYAPVMRKLADESFY